jgi:cell wall-associated NlpC family hydrolase
VASVSGLSDRHRQEARSRAVAAAILGLAHAPAIHYTQSARRWEGIADTRYAARGEYPNYADCSAFVTWCLWNGLYVPFKVRDTVNGENWKAGYTGTMLGHGKPVQHPENMIRGDAVIYGAHGSTGRHTALYIGGGLVISHGSEGGPYKLRWDYRSDVQSVRRYI